MAASITEAGTNTITSRRSARRVDLTLCPIDKRPIVAEMLTSEERQWLDDYHQMVYDRLSPHLTEEENAWLREATLPL